tara:strand:+ start:3371 stop:3778 length:408 start_codon:yes stop_codon:yes gene_type:complete
MEKRKQDKEEKKGLLRQDRENLINILLEIELQEESIKDQEVHVEDLKLQEKSGVIRQKDKYGHKIDKEDLYKFIRVYEHDLRRMRWQLMKLKDNLFYITTGKTPEEIKGLLEAHYNLVKENYEKFKGKVGDKNAV